MKVRKPKAFPILFCLILSALVIAQNPSILLTLNDYSYLRLSDTSNQSDERDTAYEGSLPYFINMPAPPQYEHTIAIVVENALYPSIVDAIDQYRQDLNDTGYNTLLYSEFLSTAEELKGNLTLWYEFEALQGAVLIGRLPYAQYRHPSSGDFSASTFICDLFLMDLDGVWTDTDPKNGIYDGHSSGPSSGDIFPEIFVGRIDPTCLTWTSSVADEVNSYLARIHDYRTGKVQRTQRALVYVDDDWAGYWGSRWANDVGLTYGTMDVVQDPVTWTNASDWRDNRLIQDYQWAHLCAHSDATMHAFGPGGMGSEGYVTSIEIQAIPSSFNFYNLFCCSGAKWTTQNNLAVTYTFTGPYGLASIGSSKTGSMMDCDEFYEPLASNATLGAALRDWFSNSLNNYGSAGSLYLEWYYGMNIVGDPLLTINYDCTVLAPQIYSVSHHQSELWYSDSFPQFNWTTPFDVNGIDGYYYVLDQNPTTVPVPGAAFFTESNGFALTESLSDGIWYLHVVARDSVGNTGNNPAHFAVRIDTTTPSVSIVQPEQLVIGTESIEIAWSVQDSHSGYSYSEVWVDSIVNRVYNATGLSCVLDGLTEGTHIVNITVYDGAMNRQSAVRTFSVDITDPILTLLNPTLFTMTEQDIVVAWSVYEIGSGYQCTEVRLDGVLIGTIGSPETLFTVENLTFGTHTVNLTVFDWVNRTDSVEFQIVIIQTASNPMPLITIVTVAVGIAVLMFYLKKR